MVVKHLKNEHTQKKKREGNEVERSRKGHRFKNKSPSQVDDKKKSRKI